MIQLIDICEALACAFIFVASILLANTYLVVDELQNLTSNKTQKSKIKIGMMTLTVFFLMTYTYLTRCFGSTTVLQCFYINPGHELVRHIVLALFLNTTLFLGGLHQQLYVR